MAGKHAIEVIDLSELWYVCGGVDKQTQAAQAALAQATSAVKSVADSVAPKNAGMTDMLMQVMSNRRSGSGPSSAPALPPTSTLSR
ncbi:MAG TPA: hypothetical protein VHW23_24840 [Kofleriaceae bacterium]|jgi:hypothetical protein|nr:hypothetical protein [Kofleriaceae bacterium]